MQTEDVRVYEVECYACATRFLADKQDIHIDLEEEYTEDDYWWIHTYLAPCPTCKSVQSVDIIGDHRCCL